MKTVAIFSVLAFAAGCQTGADRAELDTLKQQLEDLKLQVAANEGRLAACEQAAASFTAIQPELEAAADLAQVVTVDAQGDVVVSGANLRLENPQYTAGKGNIIVGIELQADTSVCIGGSRDGETCTAIGDCPAALACKPIATSDRTGVHNIVVGGNHSYRGSGNILVGSANTADDDGSLIAGMGNTATAAYALVGGGNNQVTAGAASVLGGVSNANGGFACVVVGGQNHTTDSTSCNVGIVP